MFSFKLICFKGEQDRQRQKKTITVRTSDVFPTATTNEYPLFAFQPQILHTVHIVD